MTKLTYLADLDMLESAIAESLERPVVLFKHSRTCGISCEALEELHSHIERAEADAAYKLITVQSHRHLSDEAEVRLGVRHQTPQVIVLRNGKPIWNASHFRITAEELSRAISAN